MEGSSHRAAAQLIIIKNKGGEKGEGEGERGAEGVSKWVTDAIEGKGREVGGKYMEDDCHSYYYYYSYYCCCEEGGGGRFFTMTRRVGQGNVL